jgi:IS1 family transposase
MNKLTTERRVQVVKCLVEGNSIRSTVRITGVAKNTVTKLLVDMGTACAAYQDSVFVNLPCKRLQVDEIWSFIGCKEKNVAAEDKGQLGRGDIWTWTAIDADTKLVPSWLVGARDSEYAHEFMNDVAKRLANRVEITSDGLKCCLQAVEDAFGWDVDYAVLQKHYGTTESPNTKYSPAVCSGCSKEIVKGDPDPRHVSTSFVERQNLTMQMKMRRFTRLTNAFSKKMENRAHAIALHFMHYNFARIHQTIRSTPAMKAGVTDHLWSIEEMVDLLDKYNF